MGSVGSHPPGCIEVRGARENNLKAIDVDIPKRRVILFTGVSSSAASTVEGLGQPT